MLKKQIKMARLFLLVICCNILSIELWGQDLKQDLAKMQSLYQINSNIHLKMYAEVYDLNQNSSKAEVRYEGELKIGDNQYFYEQDENLMLTNGNYMLVVNKGDKWIALKKQEVSTPKVDINELLFSTVNLDSLMTVYSSIEYKGVDHYGKLYEIKIAEGPTTWMKLWMTKDHHLKRMEYNYDIPMYDQKVKTVLHFSHIKFNSDFTKTTFSIDPYVEKKGGEWQATSRYKDYEVIQTE